MRFYVARALDAVPETPEEIFRVRILSVYDRSDYAVLNIERRKAMGEKDLVVVTDTLSRKDPRRPRQIIVAKVGTGKPGTPRFTTWS